MITLCALTSMVILAQSQPPSPSTGPASQQQKQQTSTKTPDATVGPSISAPVQPEPQQPQSPPQAQQPQQNTSGQQQQSAGDGWLTWMSGLSNVVIALVTIALAVVAWIQAGYMRDALIETKIAADAAKKSADAASHALLLNRPYLDLQNWRAEIYRDFPKIGPYIGLIVRYDIRNFGQTAARVDRVEWTMAVDISQERQQEERAFLKMIAPGQTISESLYYGRLPHRISDDIPKGTGMLFLKVAGRLAYRDQFRNIHRKRFNIDCTFSIHQAAVDVLMAGGYQAVTIQLPEGDPRPTVEVIEEGWGDDPEEKQE